MNTLLKTIIGVSILVIGGVIFFSLNNKSEPIEEVVENEEILEEEEIVEETTTTIQLPLASMETSGDFGPFGCGQYINYHPVEVPETTAPLTAVYEQLFSLPYEVDGSDDKNILASQENLSFDLVEIEDGMALVYLSGTVMGNHCADEVFRHQIQESAFQFDTVDSITVFLNGEVFDWCSLSDADPSESGCDENPKPWVAEEN